MNSPKLSSLVFVALLLAFTSLPALATMEQQRNMLDQLDQLDHQEFLALTEKAYVCIHSRDFGCAEGKLTKASKYLTNPQDRKALNTARKDLAAERRYEQEEIAAATEHARQEQLARQRAAEAEAERQRREERAQQEASNDSLVKGLFAIGTGAYVGSVTNNTDLGVAAAKSVYTGDMEGFNSAVDQAKAEREQAYNAKMAAIREQRAREGAERAERAQRERAARDEQYAQAKREREERASADHRREAAREQATRAEAQGKADTRLAQENASIRQQEQKRLQKQARLEEQVRQQEQTRQREQERKQAQERQREQARQKAEAEKVRMAAVEAAKPKWGPIQLEAVAICRQSKKSGKWVCYGPLDNQIIVDEPTLESALARQHCAGGTWAAGGPTLDGVPWEAYVCGHSLGAGDNDIVKRYGLITAQRSYICPKNQGGDGRCSTFYDGQDKR